MKELNKKEIIELYKKGYSSIKLGKKFNVSQKTISNKLNKWGVSLDRSKYKSPMKGKKHTKQSLKKMSKIHKKYRKELNNDMIKKMYLRGDSNKKIKEKVGCCYPTLKKRLEEMKVYKKKERIKIKKEDLNKYYIKQGLSLVKTGQKLNCSERTIKDRLKEYGIKVRNLSKSRIGIKFSKETKRKMKIARAKQICPVKDTSIEVKIQNFLSLLHIEFFTHKYISEINHGYQCDILIPVQNGIAQKIIIECDGCYWHGCPICKLNSYKKLGERKQLDSNRTKELQEQGFKVIRIWEHKIRVMELNDFEEMLGK